ncbi:MAG TPA: aldo/keto reductase [Microlunatus sp.]|nr:aldo/keto reductase [Microlunatus sp.]
MTAIGGRPGRVVDEAAGVRTSGVARYDMYVCTKLAAEIKDYDAAVAAIDGSLDKLGLDHVDLMLIHSPQPWNDFRGATTPRATGRPGGP